MPAQARRSSPRGDGEDNALPPATSGKPLVSRYPDDSSGRLSGMVDGGGEKAMMEYKGYLASVEYDDSADVLHGRIANSGSYPIATFEAAEAGELRREFERSVDEYLEWCEEDGVEPRRPFSGKLNVRLGSALRGAAATERLRRSDNVPE